ncbi:MAG: hypothetical protein AB1716_22325 [Planctomycetota bacterium]
MSYIGEVRDGVIVLENGVRLPDGTRVNVEPIDGEPENERRPGWADELLKLAGKAKGLPADLADNHDHYLYGTPKK